MAKPGLDQRFLAYGIRLPVWPLDDSSLGCNSKSIRIASLYLDGLHDFRSQIKDLLLYGFVPVRGLALLLKLFAQQSSWHRIAIADIVSDVEFQSLVSVACSDDSQKSADSLTVAQEIATIFLALKNGEIAASLQALHRIIHGQSPDAETLLQLLSAYFVLMPSLAPCSEPEEEPSAHWTLATQIYIGFTKLLRSIANNIGKNLDLNVAVGQLRVIEGLASRLENERNSRNSTHDAASLVSMIANSRRVANPRPKLRLIHHAACTGGTVISKCLAAMSDVALISEINPLNRFGSRFEPTNPLLLLGRSYRELTPDEIRYAFVHQIGYAAQICAADGVHLIIRDHSHSDFFRGSHPSSKGAVCEFLADHYQFLSVLTIRHPLDSYLGLLAKGWEVHFSPESLDEYSRRYLAFLDSYPAIPVLRYEDFCCNPSDFMREVCGLMELEYDPRFMNKFGDFELSGDSGRRSNFEIAIRSRRSIPDAVLAEIASSKNYSKLLSRLGYPS